MEIPNVISKCLSNDSPYDTNYFVYFEIPGPDIQGR